MGNRILSLILAFFVVGQLSARDVIGHSQQQDGSVRFNCSDSVTLQLTLCSPGVVKILYGAFDRLAPSASYAVVNERLEEAELQVRESELRYEIFTSELIIKLEKHGAKLAFYDKWQKLLCEDYDQGYSTDNKSVVCRKSLLSRENFLGLGEKSGTLNRRGNSYKMWNSDRPCYCSTEDPLYKSIPFFMSSNGYGIFFDNTYKSEFDFGATSKKYYSFSAPDGAMRYYFIFGPDFKRIISRYTELTGKPIMPPRWAFGLAQCRGMLTSESLSLEIANGYRKRAIPCDVIYQDIGWTQNLQDFQWRTPNYRNPKAMIDSLRKQGFKVIVSQDPVISQSNKRQWNDANDRGFLTQDVRTGKSYDMPFPWGGTVGVVDFTNPDVAQWWGDYQQKPIDDGVCGFWTDMGEPAWTNEETPDRLFQKHYAGMHDEVHNIYGLQWDKAVTEQWNLRNPDRRIFQMTRAGYAGLQRYTFGWSGDSGNGADPTQGWEQLANQIQMGVSAGMGLIPFWSCDISGYCGDIKDYAAFAQLYTRWLQFGVFNPLSRIHHEGNNAVEPWLFGPDVERIAKQTIERKYKLIPYIYTYAREAYDTGLPLMRSLLLEYPTDNLLWGIDDQFLFGKELLIAPVVEQDALSRPVYLPAGQWIDYTDKKTIYGGKQTIEYNAPLDVTPIFVKVGSIIPTTPVMQHVDEKVDSPIIFEVFPASLGKKASFTLYEDDGESLQYQQNRYAATPIEASTTEHGVEITVAERQDNGYRPSARSLIIEIFTIDEPKTVLLNNKKIKSSQWKWDSSSRKCSVVLEDGGQLQKLLILKNNYK